MSSRRVGRIAVMLAATLVCVSCGQIYRPVVIPTVTTPPNPANFHSVFGLNVNIPGAPGAAVQISVSGDVVIGQTPSDANSANVGINPTHIAVLPSNARVFVASAGSMFAGGADVVASFSPSFDSTVSTGLGTVFKFPLPNLVPNSDPTQPPFFCSYLPDFVATSQSTVVYVANYGVENGPGCNRSSTDSVAVLSNSTNTISNIVYLAAGSHPVGMAETVDGRKLYVANQGNNTVTSFNTVDMSQNTVVGFSGTTPVWVVARHDNHRVYVLTQGDGQLVTLDTASDSVIGSLSVGTGANFIAYDSRLSRLYVANPNNGTVYVISTTGSANDTPTLLRAITIPTLSACPTCSALAPTQVAALRDGSRFYVAGYQTATVCPDLNVAGACVIPQLTVVDANSLNVKTSMYLLAAPAFNPTPATNPPPYAVPSVVSCAPSATYAPGSTRFRMTTAAAADSSRVYVGMCDAGAVASVNTTTSTVGSGSTNTPDTLVLDMLAPFSGAPAGVNGEPPPQQPIFLLTGQ